MEPLYATIYGLLFALTLGSAVMVVFSRHAVHSALYLVVTMISIAGIFVFINAQLAAVLQVLVYAGAIMVLFLFVVMLLNLGQTGEAPRATRMVRRVGGPVAIVFAIQLLVLAVRYGGEMEFAEPSGGTLSIGEVALVLLTKYLYAFEMTSVMLLVAIVGAMALAGRGGGSTGEAHE